jgi:O-succinylbenzoic acid--CoA ligase
MKVKSCFDAILWQERLENDVTYCLSAEEGVVAVEGLDLGSDVLAWVSSCFLIKSSGSSGVSKWVVHSKRGLIKHAALVNTHLGVTKKDVLGLILPTYHVGGLGVVLRAYVSGAKLAPFTTKWSARCCVDFLTENKVSILSLVPTQLVDIVAEGLVCPDCVRVVVVGGGRLDSELQSGAGQLGWPIKKSYGMTETGSQIATGQLTGQLTGNGFLSIIDGWQVRLNDEGVLELKSDCLFKGYLVGRPGNFEFIDPKVDGWFATSDLADLIEIDGKMGMKFSRRSDQQVKILGELVDVSSLENSLTEVLRHEVYLIALSDERRGMKLFPVVDRASLIHTIRDLGWSGLHHLEEPVIVPDFPRNAMGKLQRVKLAEAVESIVFSAD